MLSSLKRVIILFATVVVMYTFHAYMPYPMVTLGLICPFLVALCAIEFGEYIDDRGHTKNG